MIVDMPSHNQRAADSQAARFIEEQTSEACKFFCYASLMLLDSRSKRCGRYSPALESKRTFADRPSAICFCNDNRFAR